MTDGSATPYGVSSFDDRDVLGAACRVVRSLVDCILVGVGAVAAACALACAGTGAAIWIVSSALATHPSLSERALIGPAALALADPDLASAYAAADFTGSIAASSAPAYTPAFEDQRAVVRGPGSARPVADGRGLAPSA